MAKGERMVSARTEWALLVLLVRSIVLPVPTSAIGFGGIPGDYCLLRKPVQCCKNRDDDCTMPILGNHLCYCDRFCKRDDGDDCCPDFRAVCEGIQPSPSPQIKGCHDELGTFYPAGGPYKVNCNSCSCTLSRQQYKLQCEEKNACLIQEDLLRKVSQGQYSWKATNYSTFWGQTLDDGVKYRLGTLYPERSVKNMNEILIEPTLPLPERFDARERWPGFIYPVRDQGNCGASWAFSTTAVSADRLAIQSGGKYHHVLSSQQLLSCNQARQRGCNGGYLDRAWWYIRKYGVVSEECYPYVSGRTNEPGECHILRSTSPTEIKCPSGSEDRRVFKMTPPYRISTSEDDIMTEIMSNGPVQTTFLVHEDFFMYKSGVYRHLRLAAEKGRQYEKSGYHSVRIIGWGVDHSTGTPIKYWLCANSWGENWGENGLFRIVRGENHCDIETFVIGAWGKGSKKRRRKFKVVRKLRHLRRQQQQM